MYLKSFWFLYAKNVIKSFKIIKWIILISKLINIMFTNDKLKILINMFY